MRRRRREGQRGAFAAAPGPADCMLWQAQVIENAGGRLDWILYIPHSGSTGNCFGGDPSEHPNLMWSELSVPELAEMNQRSTDAIRSGLPEYEQEFRALREGRRYLLREQVSITRVAPDRWNLVGVITDVTMARQAEEARRASEAQLRQIVDRVDCLLWHGEVTETGGQINWMMDVPASGLQRRIFGGEGPIRTADLYTDSVCRKCRRCRRAPRRRCAEAQRGMSRCSASASRAHHLAP